MAFFEWSPIIVLGIEDMDQGHRSIVDHMNRLHDANMIPGNREILVSALEGLYQVTCDHFLAEEKLMESIRYKDLEVHRSIHRDLQATLLKHLNAFKESQEQHLPEKFFEFLRKWLTVHILGNDRRYAAAAK